MPANNTALKISPVSHSKGFTLVELIIGLVVFAIAMSLFVSLIVPQAIRSVDPVFQVRAAELGQSLISEIASKPFDENSSRTGGFIRCNEGTACSVINSVSNSNIEEGINNRDQFDDVDDYNGLSASGDAIKNSLNLVIRDQADTLDLYAGFTVNVAVFYDDNLDGINDGASIVGNTKLITVTITTPNNEDIVFSTYRANY